jgi:hypothetical protein
MPKPRLSIPHGTWQTNTSIDQNLITLLPLKLLKKLRGNRLDKTRLAVIEEMLIRNGLNEPILLAIDTKRKLAGILDLNHRVVVLNQLEYTHAPVVVVKATLSLVRNDDSPNAHEIKLKDDYDLSENPTAVSLGIAGALPYTRAAGFATGQPATLSYMRNTAPATKMPNGEFGTDVEPHGRYISQCDPKDTCHYPNYEYGTITIRSPFVIAFGGGYADPSNWKRVLAAHYDKAGRALSLALLSDGFDGIITYNNYGTSEIVDLTCI